MARKKNCSDPHNAYLHKKRPRTKSVVFFYDRGFDHKLDAGNAQRETSKNGLALPPEACASYHL
jgi:hypothetical protein